MTSSEQERRFEALLGEHQRIVFKVASIYAHSKEDRRDLAQEICAQLWRAFSRYDEQRKFSTWMYRIALNVGISYLRHYNSSQPVRLEPLETHHLETIAGEPPIEPDERLQILYGFIDRLDPLNRALIMLYLGDHGYADIAEILGISETNVATKINRIKQRLRRQVNDGAVTTTGVPLWNLMT